MSAVTLLGMWPFVASKQRSGPQCNRLAFYCVFAMLSDFGASGSSGLKRPAADSPGATPKKIREFLMTFPVAVFLLASKIGGKKEKHHWV